LAVAQGVHISSRRFSALVLRADTSSSGLDTQAADSTQPVLSFIGAFLLWWMVWIHTPSAAWQQVSCHQRFCGDHFSAAAAR